jgi:hypothetical protein
MGARVEFPSDLSRAAYSVIAAGVCLPPQRIEMPFSLVRKAHGELASRASLPETRPVENEILPAWVLAESPYTLVRAARKNAERYAVTGEPMDPDPLRPEVLAPAKTARDALAALPEREVYGQGDLAGLGASAMTGEWRRRALDAYGAALRRKSLEALMAALSGAPLAGALDADPLRDLCRLHREILAAELGGATVAGALEEYVGLEQAFAEAVERSKGKDDARGARVQPGYAAVHVPAAEDEVVRSARARGAGVARKVEALLARR